MADSRLGRRLISAAKQDRWERTVEAAVRQALARHQARALAAARTVTASSPPDPFEIDTWDTSVDEVVVPAVRSVLSEAADSAVAFLSLPPDVRARVLAALDVDSEAESFVGRIRGIGPDIAEQLRLALNSGLRQGESIGKLQARIGDVFAVGERRSEAIARTEVHGAAMRAGNTSAGALHDSGTAMIKTWMTTLDDRTRDDHADADGQEVPFDQPFVVGGEELDYPGDPSGSAENVINCRCDVIYDEAPIEGEEVMGELPSGQNDEEA